MKTIDPFDCTFDETAVYGNWTSDASTTVAVEAVIEEEAIVAQGRKEGREAGLMEGFRDGRLLGQTKGVDYGMEIGFATGLLEAVRSVIASNSLSAKHLSSSSSSSGSLDRIVKSADDLEKAIRDFPACEETIRKRLFRTNDRNTIDDEDNDDDNEEDEDEQVQNNTGPSTEDVRSKLQRIRARCKVLVAKLGIPRHSLKTILTEASQNKASAASSPSLSKNGAIHLANGGGHQDW
jgi:hypothetical protein